MPVLKNAKHERMAQAITKGLSAEKAYAAAGYKPHRGNAARLSANESIKARVAELHRKQVDKIHEYAAVNVREEMQLLRAMIADARKDGDIKTAMQGQMFIMKMFGFEDMPTLTHEMLGERGLQKSAPAQSAGQDEPRNVLQFSRVHQELDRLITARTIEHDPQKK